VAHDKGERRMEMNAYAFLASRDAE
jgi:hypothetical protein